MGYSQRHMKKGTASRGLAKPQLPASGRNTYAPGQAAVRSPCLLAWHCPGMHPAVLQQVEIHPAHLAHTKLTHSPDTDYAPKSRVHQPSSGNTPYLPPPCPHSPAPPGTICMRWSWLAHKSHICCFQGRIPVLHHEGAYRPAEGHSPLGQVRHSSLGLARGALAHCTCLNWHGPPRHPTLCSPPGLCLDRKQLKRHIVD